MKKTQFVSQLVLSGAMCVLVALSLNIIAAPATAGTLDIQFTGMDLVYDGSAIYDGGSTAGGLANPADADPLTEVEFYVDGSLVGSLNSDVSLDAYIPDVTGISSAAGTIYNQSTPGNPGFFDLLIGTSPLASQFLLIDLADVNITYVDVANVVQFTFGAAVADSFAQNLPFGLVIGDPVTVTFSAQVTAGTRTTANNLVTGFRSTGTGSILGTVVPEPATCLLAAIGLISCLARRK
jgi:hypothetical protein